jgi:hypothetical protein
VTRFSRYLSGDYALALESACALLVAQLAVRCLPTASVTRWIGLVEGVDTDRPDAAGMADAARIGRYLRRIAPRLPLTVTCLAQALAGAWLLRRRGVGATVHLGLARDEHEGGLAAHAWLSCGDLDLTGAEAKAGYVSVAPLSSIPTSRRRAKDARTHQPPGGIGRRSSPWNDD